MHGSVQIDSTAAAADASGSSAALNATEVRTELGSGCSADVVVTASKTTSKTTREDDMLQCGEDDMLSTEREARLRGS